MGTHIQQYKYTCIQWYMCTDIHVYNYTSTQPCKHTKHTVNLISLLLAHMNSTKSEQICFTIKQL